MLCIAWTFYFLLSTSAALTIICLYLNSVIRQDQSVILCKYKKRSSKLTWIVEAIEC